MPWQANDASQPNPLTRDEPMNTQMTAGGEIEVLAEGKSDARGGTRVWLGKMLDGRYMVASRFQYEVRTRDRAKAEAKFASLCGSQV